MTGLPQRGHDIVVIGCSAGGVEVLPKILSKLPRNTPAAIFVAMHVSAMTESYLPRIIGRSAKMPAEHAQHGEAIQPGKIYVAPPDQHMMLTETTIELTHGPKENRHRPAVDPLFRSAARVFGPRVIGVILTGALDDGTAGLQSVKRCGGYTMVQHPDEALAPGMPLSALRYVQADHVGKLASLATQLRRMIKEPPNKQPEVGCHEDAENLNQRASMNHHDMEKRYGPPSALVCPECSGPIWETEEANHTQYRCVVGHVYSPESFVAEEGVAAERALWVAVKTLQERSDLLKRLSDKATAMNQAISAASFKEKADESQAHADVIRGVLARFDGAASK
jgi:two-component system, chemotaxis family, protein-glutamate methylesterase/glutaminase